MILMMSALTSFLVMVARNEQLSYHSDCDTIVNDVDIYVINDNATIAEAVVVRFHPLMLQIVASPGVVAAVGSTKMALQLSTRLYKSLKKNLKL